MPNKILNTTCARCVDHITNSQLRIFQNVQIKLKLVILKHIIKGIVKLIRNFLDLELLTVDLILDIINPEVQFGDVHLSVFITSLSNLESLHKLVNFALSFSSLSWAFSAEISNCFMFSPTASNSCSTSLSLPSANSALSLALFNSSS